MLIVVGFSEINRELETEITYRFTTKNFRNLSLSFSDFGNYAYDFHSTEILTTALLMKIDRIRRNRHIKAIFE